MSTELKTLAEENKSLQAQVATLSKSLEGVVEKLKKTPANGTPAIGGVLGSPFARRGENSMGSRGFSFMKMLGVITGAVPAEEAKIELDVHNRLHGILKGKGSDWEYQYKGIPNGTLANGGRFLAPLATSHLPEQIVPNEFRCEMKSLVEAGVGGYADVDQMRWMAKSLSTQGGVWGQKAMSWLTENTGGALVPPAEFGELIELLRNKEALVNAGARTVPLPPQGRIQYPRQTGPSTAYWVGESAPITDSTPQVGTLTLQAKKLAVRIIAPNELLRFASPAAEALMRDDMTKSLALGLDLAGLQGTGTDTQPRGLINLQNITLIASSSAGTNGDGLVANDVYRYLSAVQQANAEFEGWVMAPVTLNRFYQLRADAVGQGDGAGPFLFDLIRPAEAGVKPVLAGHPVTQSTQVATNLTKGNRSNLTYVAGGMWSDCLIGMFGAIEFAATTMGDTSFTQDQTWVRGILSADIGFRHESAFVWCPYLVVSPPFTIT